MDERTRSFLRSNFGKYYHDAANPESPPSVTREDVTPFPPVPDLAAREFGFIELRSPFPDDVVMHRHVGFATQEALHEKLAARPPAHAYRSAAHWQTPRARTMNDKGWLGSDLIFDLDMDHLRDMPDTFPAMLEAVKQETLRLVEEFILGDLDVPPHEIDIVFSGGRGYHVHVYSEQYRTLGGKERREIVDYVKGEITPDVYYHSGTAPHVPTPDQSGWGERINRSLRALLDEARNQEDPGAFLSEVAERHGRDVNVGKGRADAVLSYGPDRVERGFFNPGRVPKDLLEALVQEAAHRGGAEIDEPVTSDTHRLIRIPGTLHGGSGLQVKPLTLEQLRDFSPLTDAVVFNDDPILVEGRGFTAFLRGEKYEAPEGEEVEVPRYAAVFMALRGGAAVK